MRIVLLLLFSLPNLVVADSSRLDCSGITMRQNNSYNDKEFPAEKLCEDIESGSEIRTLVSTISKDNKICWYYEKPEAEVHNNFQPTAFYMVFQNENFCPSYTDDLYARVAGFESVARARTVYKAIIEAIASEVAGKGLEMPFYYRLFSSDVKDFMSSLKSISPNQVGAIVKSIRPGGDGFLIDIKIHGKMWEIQAKDVNNGIRVEKISSSI